MISRVLSYTQILNPLNHLNPEVFPLTLRDRNDVYNFYADVNDQTAEELVAFYMLETANPCPDSDW